MVSVTFVIDDGVREDMKKFSWVTWSEVAQEEVMKDLTKSEQLAKVLSIVTKSTFTEADANMLSAKVKSSLHKRLHEEGLA